MADEHRDEIEQLLTGPPTTTQPAPVDPEAGITPPTWWQGDDDATESSMVARAQAQR